MAETVIFNIAYALFVATGFVKTILRLRLALIGVAIAYIIWGVVAQNTSAIIWNVAFASVHSYQVFRLWAQRRSIQLTETQSNIHDRLFPDLDLIDFYTLWSIGNERTLKPDAVLIQQGEVQDTLMLIVAGAVVVERDDELLAELGPDDLLGERSYMTGEVASATVRATSEVELHEWDQRRMKALVDLSNPAHESMVRYISADLARKL
ncbi:MAG: cyclic nucleotide-binding domain-containing protein [Actinomycetota bacterium]